MGFLLRFIACALGVTAAAWLLEGIEFTGPDSGVAELNDKVLPVLGVALILTLVNAIVRPVVKLFTFPLIVLTLGVFTLVINICMLLLTDLIAGKFELGFVVDGLLAATLGSLFITVITWAVDAILGDE